MTSQRRLRKSGLCQSVRELNNRTAGDARGDTGGDANRLYSGQEGGRASSGVRAAAAARWVRDGVH